MLNSRDVHRERYSNVLSALDMVGGPSENGSFRSITLKDNKVIDEFDLYDVFIRGNIDFTRSLKLEM